MANRVRIFRFLPSIAALLGMSSTVQDGLSATISDEFELARGEPVQSTGSQAVSACQQDACLVVWDRSTGKVVATHVDAGGSQVSSPVELPTVQGRLTRLLPYGSDQYLLITRSTNSSAYVLNASTGEVTALLSDTLPLEAQFVALGSHIGVLYRESNSTALSMGYLDASGQITLQQQVEPDLCSYSYGCSGRATAASGSGYVAVAWSGHLRRYAESTLVPVDTTPLVVNEVSTGTPRMGFDGTNFVLAWSDGSRGRLSRVRASDGAILDPDDVFNNVPGSLEIVYSPYNPPSIMSVQSNAPGEVLVAFKENTSTIDHRIRLVRVRTGDTEPLELDELIVLSGGIADSNHVMPVTDFSWAQTWGLATATEDSDFEWIRGGIILTESNGSIAVDSTKPISIGHATVGLSAVASDGTDFVFGWLEQDKIRAARFRGYDGAPLDAPPVELATGLSDIQWLGVASKGDGYVFSYSTGSYVTLLGTDAGLSQQFKINEYGYSGDIEQVSVSCDGARCAVVYAESESSCTGLHGRRFDTAGQWLGTTETLINCSAGVDRYTLVGAANSQPQPSYRSFMLAWSDTYTDLRSARYRSESGAFIMNPTDYSTGFPTMMGSDGTQFLVGYEVSDTTYLVGLDNLDGSKFPAAPVEAIAAADVPYVWPFIAFDGTDYAIVSQGLSGDVQLRYYATDITAAEPTLDLATAPVRQIGAAANQYGRTLVAFPRTFAPSSNPGYRSVGVFVDNDRGPGTPPPTDAGPGDASAEGGPDDASTEASVDASVDADPDTAQDVSSDTEVDAPAADASGDGALDALDDSATDALSDVPDAWGSDAGLDGPAVDSAADGSVFSDASAFDGSASASGGDSDGGGCGCRTPPAGNPGAFGGYLLALAAAFGVYGRRRRAAQQQRRLDQGHHRERPRLAATARSSRARPTASNSRLALGGRRSSPPPAMR